MSLAEYRARCLPALEGQMRHIMSRIEGKLSAPFADILRYHMGWEDRDGNPTEPGGKRIRPLLLMLICESVGGSWEAALPAASAVELIHNFSLVHDDVQDMSDYRHGRLTVWKLWGEAQAINAGDALFALAHLAMSELGGTIPPQKVLEAFELLDITCLRLTQGQYLDMAFETRENVSEDDYLVMIGNKSAALISASCELGALVGGASPELMGLYADFGLHMGLAFQIRDDILGTWGDPSVTGKSAATDIMARKKTLPVVYGLRRSGRLRELFAKPRLDEADVTEAVGILNELGAKEYTEQQEELYFQKGMAALDTASPSGEAGEALYELTRWLLRREY